jgi:hypothetical protein
MSLKKSSRRICVTREQIPFEGLTTFAAVDRRSRCLHFGERGRERNHRDRSVPHPGLGFGDFQ